jgi:hypothetical protein
MGKFRTLQHPNSEMVIRTNPKAFKDVQNAFPIFEQPKVQEKIVEVIVEKIVYVDKPTTVYETKEIEVIKEVPIYKDRIVEKEVIKEIEKPIITMRDVFHEKIVEVPKIILQKKIPNWVWSVMGIQALGIIILLIK